MSEERTISGIKVVVSGETYDEYKGTLQEQLEEKDKEIERLHSIINELEKELIDVTKFKNNILDDLEKRTLEVNKLRDKLKLKKGEKMKEELQEFNINLEDIEENIYLFDNINEAIEKMKKATLKDRFEVVLNNNLIEAKDKYTGFRTILGCRITYDNLDKNISFVVREDNKPTYEELENQLQQKENIIKEVREYIKWHYDLATDENVEFCLLRDRVLEILEKEVK